MPPTHRERPRRHGSHHRCTVPASLYVRQVTHLKGRTCALRTILFSQTPRVADELVTQVSVLHATNALIPPGLCVPPDPRTTALRAPVLLSLSVQDPLLLSRPRACRLRWKYEQASRYPRPPAKHLWSPNLCRTQSRRKQQPNNPTQILVFLLHHCKADIHVPLRHELPQEAPSLGRRTAPIRSGLRLEIFALHRQGPHVRRLFHPHLATARPTDCVPPPHAWQRPRYQPSPPRVYLSAVPSSSPLAGARALSSVSHRLQGDPRLNSSDESSRSRRRLFISAVLASP